MAPRPYAAVNFKVETAPRETFRVLAELVETRGWTVVEMSKERLELVAITPARDLGPVPVRNEWHFAVRAHGVELRKNFQAYFEEEGWVGSADICGDYQYREEGELQADIARMLDQSRRSVAMR